MSINIEDLKKIGFKDVSSDSNGLAYRKRVNGLLELCYYVSEGFVRLQTVSAGFTSRLEGVNCTDDLIEFLVLLNKSGKIPKLNNNILKNINEREERNYPD